MNRPRILVAGANYGRAYLSALAHAPNRFELAGLLATGSARSVRAAAECGIPLYRSVAELPDQIDLVCAALGSRGFSVVLDLLRRRIPVLCEHPLSPRLLDTALQESAATATPFHVNGHFAMLPSSRNFSRRVSALGQDPVFLDIFATDRSLYAALDILFMSIGRHTPFQVAAAKPGQPFVTIEASLASTPLILRLQVAQASPIPDGDATYLVDYRITAGFRSGILTLLSMGGPVLWTVNYACPQAEIADQSRQASPDQLSVQRKEANLEAIEQILGKRIAPEQQPEHLRAVSTAWQKIGEASRL